MRLAEFQPRKAKYGFKTTFATDILEICNVIITALGTKPDGIGKSWWLEASTSNGTGTLIIYINDPLLRDQLFDAINA